MTNSEKIFRDVLSLACYLATFLLLCNYDVRVAIAWFMWRLGHTIKQTMAKS